MENVRLEGSQEVEAAGRNIRDAANLISQAVFNLIPIIDRFIFTAERLIITIEKLDVQETGKRKS
jgi:hypothetical protein